jgi:hypothetical protein
MMRSAAERQSHGRHLNGLSPVHPFGRRQCHTFYAAI